MVELKDKVVTDASKNRNDLIDVLQHILPVKNLVAILARVYFGNDHPYGMLCGNDVVASSTCSVLRTARFLPVATQNLEVRPLMEGFLRIAWSGFAVDLLDDPLR